MTDRTAIRTRSQLAWERLRGFASANEPLAPYTTYRVGGPAAVLAKPQTVAQLRMIGEVAVELAIPVLVVGRGSNMLVADEGFPGIAVSVAELVTVASPDGIMIDGTRVTAAASVALPVLARRTAAAGLTGFEWAVGVPGSIGGAVRMNAGGHGSDMSEVLVTARLFDLHTCLERVWPACELGLRFRGSRLGDDQVVLAAELALAHGDVSRSESMLAEVVRWRREHQPGGQNAGSVFVNPVPGELAAAELIDRLGLRGFRVGGAEVSTKHANFIQATEGATAADVRAVIEHVRARVSQETGFDLRSEVRLVGFADDLTLDRAEETSG